MSQPPRRTFLRSISSGIAAAALARVGVASAQVSKQAPPEFKYAICNETFLDWPLEKAFGFAAECGYSGIEIAPFTLADDVRTISSQRRSEVRREAEKAGLEVIGLHWLLAKTEGLHLTSPDADTRKRTAAYLGDLARFCADLGGKILVFGSPKQRNLAQGMDRATGMRYAADVFSSVLPVLEQTQTLLALEPLSPTTTNILTTAAEAVELIRKVDSPRCRLQLDCLAMSKEAVPIPELVRKHRADLAHFHANDPNSQGPGFGQLDFRPILTALREIEYAGWISVEVFDNKPGPERLARESIANLRKCAAETPGR